MTCWISSSTRTVGSSGGRTSARSPPSWPPAARSGDSRDSPTRSHPRRGMPCRSATSSDTGCGTTSPPRSCSPNPASRPAKSAHGLLRRLDYTTEVNAGDPVAHYTEGYKTFDGLTFPTRRRVYRSNPGSTPTAARPPLRSISTTSPPPDPAATQRKVPDARQRAQRRGRSPQAGRRLATAWDCMTFG